MPIVGIDHVQLAMPEGEEERARAFYSKLLGLSEVAKPPELAVIARGSARDHCPITASKTPVT